MLRATTKSYDIVGSDEYYTDYWEINDERILPHIGYGSKNNGLYFNIVEANEELNLNSIYVSQI